MATTTTNYGFDVPTSSDLVKNGATAISTLGQDIDTFLNRPLARNGVINSAFDIWQRGTSIAVTSGAFPYTADRWNFFPNGANNAHTVSRQATNDTTNLPNIQYAGRFQRNAGQTGTGAVYLCNSFETINSIPYVGKQVTFSFYARAGANFSSSGNGLYYRLYSGTGTDQLSNTGYTGATAVIGANATLTTTWQRFTATGTVGATATELSIEFSHTPSGTAGAADYYEITGVQLELGSQATPFTRNAGTSQGERYACERYYQRFTGSDYAAYGTGMATSTTLASVLIPFTTTMRITPTAVDYSGTQRLTDEVSSFTSSTVSLIAVESTPQKALVTVAATGLTQYRTYYYAALGASSTYVGFSAEL